MHELRPRTVGEILDAAFKLYTSNVRTLLIISAVVFVPIGILQLVVTSGVGVEPMDLLSPDFLADGRVPPEFMAFLGGTVLVALISTIGTIFVQGAAIDLFAAQYRGAGRTWQEAVRFGIDKSLFVLAAVLLSGIGSVAGLFLCLVPGVWLWTSWYVAVPAVLVEDIGPIKAMTRSFRLVKQRFWPVLGVGALAFLITIVIEQLLGLIVTLVTVIPSAVDAAETGSFGTGVFGPTILAGVISSIVTVPFLAAVAVSVYFDLRVRFEGFDLEMLSDTGPEPEVPKGFEPEPGPDDPFGLD